MGNLANNGFKITALTKPEPPEEMLNNIPAMADELRRPMIQPVPAVKGL